jgi:hypothetical protein
VSKRIDDGGAAFPTPPVYCAETGCGQADAGQGGMSMRDYFAAAALTGFLAAGRGPNGYGDIADSNNAADYAYEQADAMLRRRAAEGGAA